MRVTILFTLFVATNSLNTALDCDDYPDFRDKDNLSCATYTENSIFCSGAKSYANSDGVSADEACCACEGGHRKPSSEDTTPSEEEEDEDDDEDEDEDEGENEEGNEEEDSAEPVECTDFADFMDKDKLTCETYTKNPTFCNGAEAYANSDGVAADVACCVCNGGEKKEEKDDYSPANDEGKEDEDKEDEEDSTESIECTDFADFMDKDKLTCETYGKNPGFCNGAKNYANSDGVSADVACCACNGGEKKEKKDDNSSEKNDDSDPSSSDEEKKEEICTDFADFKDKDNLSCGMYTENPVFCNGAKNFANSDGVSADVACCACNGGTREEKKSDTTPDTDDVCTDIPHYVDSLQAGCDIYKENPIYCESADRVINTDGVSPKDACCACGGGSTSSDGKEDDEEEEDDSDKPCEDDTKFADSGGLGCNIYTKKPHWCEFSSKWANDDGVSASDVCCVCKEQKEEIGIAMA